MSDVIDTYKIQFLRREIHGRFWNIMTSSSEVLDQLIDGYPTPYLINEFLIQEINNVLDGIIVSETIISETMVSAVITPQNTNLYQDPHYDPTSNPDFNLPTIDLHAIAHAWLQFVFSNPTS